jgi:hypothetical protein
MKCQILTFINSLKITYIPIILLLKAWRKIHISENREKITVQRLKYQGVNEFYGSKAMFGDLFL